MEVCECCHRLKKPLQIATFELCDTKVRACLPCIRETVGTLKHTPLAQRIERLQGMKERWKERFEERAS